MPRPAGNTRLKAARQHAGYASQQALADAMTAAAPLLGLGNMQISARQIRRWESASPPWPRADHQRLLVHVLQLPVDQLGFTPPWESSDGPAPARPNANAPAIPGNGATLPLPKANVAVQDKIELKSEFDLTLPAAPNATALSASNTWDSGIWGQSLWGATSSTVVNQDWQSIGGTGYSLSLCYQITSGAVAPIDAELIDLELMYTTTGSVA